MKKDYKDEKNWRLGGIACVPIPEGIEVFVDMILIVSKKCFSYWHEDKTSYKILMYFSANIYNKTRINDKFCFRSDLLSFLSVFFFSFLFVGEDGRGRGTEVVCQVSLLAMARSQELATAIRNSTLCLRDIYPCHPPFYQFLEST